MKKFIWPLIVVFLVVFAFSGIYFLSTKKDSTKEDRVGTFNLENYSDKIDRFYSGDVLGPTLSAEDAKEKALPILKKTFGDETFERKEPYHVAYDAKNKAWHIFGSLPKGQLGGVTHIIIRQDDGMVLAVWGEK